MCLCVMACMLMFTALVYYVGVFGDKWQKRYFILNGPVLNYFKKYGVKREMGGKEIKCLFVQVFKYFCRTVVHVVPSNYFLVVGAVR